MWFSTTATMTFVRVVTRERRTVLIPDLSSEIDRRRLFQERLPPILHNASTRSAPSLYQVIPDGSHLLRSPLINRYR